MSAPSPEPWVGERVARVRPSPPPSTPRGGLKHGRTVPVLLGLGCSGRCFHPSIQHGSLSKVYLGCPGPVGSPGLRPRRRQGGLPASSKRSVGEALTGAAPGFLPTCPQSIARMESCRIPPADLLGGPWPDQAGPRLVRRRDFGKGVETGDGALYPGLRVCVVTRRKKESLKKVYC